jgi:SAM-dependent methyltransferase
MEQIGDFIQRIVASDPARIIVSKPAKPAAQQPFRKVVFTRAADAGFYRAERFTDRQAFHASLPVTDLAASLAAFMDGDFLQLNAFHAGGEFILLVSRKGRPTLTSRRTEAAMVEAAAHDRKKQYIFAEGQVIEPLVDMGIFTAEGQIVKAMHDKYRQINRFIEMIDDEIRDSGLREINVIDFGCGKSYLTFLLYYYFHFIKGINATMTGLDLKEDVISRCNAVARKYQYDQLHFQVGDIAAYQADKPVDLVIALHACDTATDFALLHALKWQARMIFSVPCCQHELNQQMKSDPLAIVTRYGIIKERVAAALTDAIRANLLTACGYRTQLLEFISLEHTPKNVLIRAVRAPLPQSSRVKALAEVQRLQEVFQVDPTLLRLLVAENLIAWPSAPAAGSAAAVTADAPPER